MREKGEKEEREREEEEEGGEAPKVRFFLSAVPAIIYARLGAAHG